MTMLTIIISSVVLLQFGLSGTTGMFFVMAIAGMVCTALSVSGQTITDLKTGYWLGSTPAAQEKVKFLGVIAAAASPRPHHRHAGADVPVRRGGARRHARRCCAAPQASIMKALVEGFMSHQPVAYHPVRRGRSHRDHRWRCSACPALIFALGMYLPLELNSPALVGGFLAHFLGKRAEREGGARGRVHPRARRRSSPRG